MDKEWIHLPSRLVPEYEEGVQKFLAQAKEYAKTRKVITCPCIRCKNKKYMTFDKVYEHLIIKGFDPSYTIWFFHGETDTPQFQGDGSSGGVQEEKNESREAFHLYKDVFVSNEEVGHTMSDARDYEFADLLEDAETPLFSGCTTYTKLSAAVTLYNYKSTNGHTDSSFNELLKILGDMLPEKNTLPETVYSMKKLLKPFDLGYEKIHACPNDCCLFRKELKDLDSCPKCGSSRWKVDKVTFKVRKGVPEKVLRYFPVIPRLKRMYKSEEMAEDLIWHSNHKSQDHMMRHPVDSAAWDTINHKWPAFASDPRNLRLALATDGFNPFGDLSSRYSCWPVMLVNYNLPPLMCMSKENIMLTLLIPGPKQPGNDIDVYLEPLVEDLKELWDTGVEAYDAFSKSMFNLKAILMWTINDFPAYGNLAGCATKGKVGCPICGEDEKSAKFVAMREKQRYNHTMSRRGYARLTHIMETTSPADTSITRTKVWVEGHKKKNGEPISEAVAEKMKEIEECAPESQNTTKIVDDSISLVFGKEPRGRVCGMGFGVTPSKLGAYVQQNGTMKQLQSTVHNLERVVEEMRSTFFQNMRKQTEQEQVASGGGTGIGNDIGSGCDITHPKKSVNADNVNQHQVASQSNSKNMSRGDIPENTKCKLLHWCGNEIVAEGRIASTDPNVKVHHVPLGGSCWKVWVDRVLVEQVDLIRPNSEMIFLDDAIGSTVAWFSKFIVLYD